MLERPVLILSEGLDYHGIAVRWALREMGVPLDWWDRSEFPRNQRVSNWISTEESSMSVSDADVALSFNRYRTIWNRRGQVPQASDTLDRTDRVVARNESTYFLAGLASALAQANPDAMFVNAFDKAKSANPKTYQLDVAKSVGFTVPRTLVSNDPEHIRKFYALNNGRIIAKQHIPFAWRTKHGALLVTGTSAITSDHLRNDDGLLACPMIYQQALDLRNEIRIIAFGRSAFALNQIRTQTPTADGFLDIRYENTDKQAVTIDEALVARCHAYMDRLGLTYAAFDIAQLANGEYVFIEANEAGQFLFLEDQVAEIPILDAFSQFLASGDREFRYEKPGGLRLTDFELSDDAKQFHVRYDAHMKGSALTSPFELVE